MQRRSIIAIALLLLSGCASGFKETHYFRSTDRQTGETVNYFRLTVGGWDGATRARFVSGLYDERAVDYFFNELRTTGPQLSLAPSKAPNLQLQPLDGGDGGAFVLILSTDAKSVADTLGEFAENQAIADAMTNLINRDALKDRNHFLAIQNTSLRRGDAVRGQLDALFADLAKATDKETARRLQIQIVNAIASASDSPTYFSELGEVSQWVKAQLAQLPKERQ